MRGSGANAPSLRPPTISLPPLRPAVAPFKKHKNATTPLFFRTCPHLGRALRVRFREPQPTIALISKINNREEATLSNTTPCAAATPTPTPCFFLHLLSFLPGRALFPGRPVCVHAGLFLCVSCGGQARGRDGGLAPSYSSGRTPLSPPQPTHTAGRAHVCRTTHAPQIQQPNFHALLSYTNECSS